jgi:predicted RNA-binding Zn-ribbon protein involved in translation (DUF1610 family)
MDLSNFINTYQYILLPAAIIFVLVILATTWLGVLFWVARDITIRSRNLLVAAASVLLVLILNIPGLIIYLMLRPSATLEDNKDYALLYQSILDKDVYLCHSCQLPVHAEHKHCAHCGVAQTLKCAECNYKVNAAWNHCINCGAEVVLPVPKRNLLGNLKKKLFAPFRFIGRLWRAYVSFISRLIRSIRLPRIRISLRLPKFRLSLPKLNLRRAPKPAIAKQTEVVKEAKAEVKSVAVETEPKRKRGRPAKQKPVPADRPGYVMIDGKEVKLNKDGTPRKGRADAGQMRGKYKPRQG